MDPISALSLAANIFQVIGFAADVFKAAKEVYENGSLKQFAALDAACSRCRSSTKSLRTERIASAKRTHIGLELSIDPQLLDLSDQIIDVSEELQELLARIRGTLPEDPTLLGSLPGAIRSLWHRDTVKKLETKMRIAKEDLQFHLIVLVKTRLDQHTRLSAERDNILRNLNESTKLGLRSAAGSLQDLKFSSDVILDGQEKSEELAQARHGELMGLIKNLTLSQLTQDQRSSKSVPFMLHYVDKSRQELANAAVISSLWFPTMQDREDGISEAHKETFTWAYRDPQGTDQPWDNLGHFLRSGSGVYWVTGKPGSGKSTLMKYLNRNDQTSKALQSWTGPRRLNTARFYFYYNGTKMQRSQLGVFRSLLYQLLQPRPGLVQKCFGDRYMAMCFSPEEPKSFVPTVWELKRSLELLVHVEKEDTFFLSVDGLDEYEADDTEMAALVRCFEELSTLPNVKSLLSSRPLETFEQVFKGFPRLRLHDLTRPDITAFVEGKIKYHHGLERLLKKDPLAAQGFVDEIVEASSGVFLWVHLVVRSLLEGLQNYDELEDFRQRLRELPTDLADLYQHMWTKIQPRYRGQASKLLQIVETATADGARLSVMGLSFAYESDEELMYKSPVAVLSDDETATRHEAARVHIASRCMGLVEISRMGFAPSPLNNGGLFNTDLYDNNVEYGRYRQPHVVFIHRTISEFISQPNIRQQLQSAAPGFVASVALLRSAVHRIKTYMYNEETPQAFPKSLECLVYYAFGAANRAEAETGEAQSRPILELDSIMQKHQQRFMPEKLGHWSEYLVEIFDVGNSSFLSRIPNSTLFSLAIRMGLSHFVQEQVELGHFCVDEWKGRPLLDYALRPYCRNTALTSFSLSRRPEIIQLLLWHGSDPNEPLAKGITVWTAFLKGLVEDAKRDSQYFVTVPEILTLLINEGSNLNVKIRMKKFGRNQEELHDYSTTRLFHVMSKDPAGFPVDPSNWVGFSHGMKQVADLAGKKRDEQVQGQTRTETSASPHGVKTVVEVQEPPRRSFWKTVFCCG